MYIYIYMYRERDVCMCAYRRRGALAGPRVRGASRPRRVCGGCIRWHCLSNASCLKYGIMCFLRHCWSNTAN